MSVEILLATRNNMPFVESLVGSVLKQSFGDFKLTVRDDGSSDGTFEKIAELAKTDSRINVLSDREPSGSACNNFFRLLLQSDADYIMFCDADDIWLPDKVKNAVETIQNAESKYGTDTPILSHSDLTVVDESLGVIAESMFDYEKLSPERTALKQLAVQNNVTGCTTIINRALRELVTEQPKSAVMHDWWLALCASAFGQIVVDYRPMIFYRQHSGNSVGAYSALSLAQSFKRLTEKGRTRAIYDSMFSQAACFADTFADRLSKEDSEMLHAFADMKNKGKLGRISSVFRYGFYKNTFIRNIGQIIAV